MSESERHRLVGELFDHALELPESERAAFLDSACGEDTDLRREVERWIEHDLGGTGPLDRPPRFLDVPVPAGHALEAGARLGPYRLERMLGRGGMGTVFLASRDDEEFTRQVAIKLVTAGSRAARDPWRFYRERQILAHLEHPNIARLYDGGRTGEGQPYLVLEYVDGEPIDDYCERAEASLEERIRLVREVCSAVDYAHRNLVVHRDLKPSNILVDRDGRPKLLDFGIAKLISPEGTDRGLRTTVENHSPLTLSHASPEQIAGESITTASDVYCLGIVLYELLTGLHPFDDGTESTPYGLMQRVSESEPEPPSLAFAHHAAEHPEAAEQLAAVRGSSPTGLVRALEGDLDTILIQALCRQPEQRYASAHELAEDLLRHLEDRPIRAGSPGRVDRVKKFVRRHRAAVAVASLATFVLALLASTFVLALLGQVERTEREKVKAERLVRFLMDTFAVSDPESSLGETVTARALLDEGAKRIAIELHQQPDTQAAMLDAMGRIYQQIGLFEPARELVTRGLEIRRQGGGDVVGLVESLSHLASIEATEGELDEAGARVAEALDRGADLTGDQRAAYAEALEVQALVLRLQYRYEGAETAISGAIELYRQLADHPRDLAEALLEYGFLLQEQSRFDEAEAAYRESMALIRQLFGPSHPAVADGLEKLAELAYATADYAVSEAHFREALEIRLDVSGERHFAVVDLKNSFGLLLGDMGRIEEAVAMLRDAVETCEQLTGKSTEYATMASNLANYLTLASELDEAERLFQEALSIRVGALGDAHPLVGQTHLTIGRMQRRQGRLDEAQASFEKAAETARRLPAGHRAIAYPSLALVDLLLERRRGAEAESILRWALAELEETHGPDHWRTAMAEANLGRARQLQGDLEGAELHLRGALETLVGEAEDTSNETRVSEVGTGLDALSK